MTDAHLPEQERRRFTRVVLRVPTVLHQGGISWDVELLNISLNGFAVSQPGNWDADYSHPFNIALQLDDGSLELFAYLIHVEQQALGFQMENLSADQLAMLAKLLAHDLDDSVLSEELARLQQQEA
ncbi:MAG: PilZ domain-containing protein [Gammaproteobacteria bacterium]|nr:PilZ domain-containing protein [Gammaproteobacteria bacterium]